MHDNWALIHACEEAAKTGSPVAVAFNLVSLHPSCTHQLDSLSSWLRSEQQHRMHHHTANHFAGF